MYNSDLPTRAELPSTAQLIRSTVIAILAAAAILVTIVLPAEYAIDPTGIGRVLGLAEMGEIKQQLAKEAEEDRRRDQELLLDRRSGIGSAIVALFVGTAHAQAAPVVARSDEMSVTLKPGQGTEIKLAMKQGATVSYSWSATGDVNYDLHGDGSGKETSYKKGRGVAKDEGSFTAAFDGNHGWFWRNRTRTDVTVTVRANGQYAAMKKVM
ncbi:MAG: transmembrane anchor protein [Ferrovibrio sp.]|uniref:transmembrane anchor protein n=1 Tax=Ferrovibrio sp. TaxID=1917215 RepID=UPI0026359F2A|nr:transmembrane anchor protein [Ferrovibrio sp.]MCW0235841.1 transmembrane anchor protein [Ferrovibrio sp.]